MKHLPTGHPTVKLGKTGILLINLGTPDGTDAKSVRRYLAEFLSDKRVVNYPRWVWMPVLHGVILRVRPAKTGRAYAKIWNKDKDESPLRTYTRAQAKGLEARIGGETVLVDWAMRYGTPSIEERITFLQGEGCDRIVIVPLYPQFSATTTGTVNDQVFRVLQKMNWQPAIRTAPAFHDHPLYISALKQSLEKLVAQQNPERVILSFHGIPERYFKAGDPYHCHCQKTARLVREAMGWDADFAPLGFQSKFGPEKWLGPSTEDLVIKAGEEGLKNIAVIAPAFVSDCIETLEELAIELKETFLEHGGTDLTAVPCLNDSPEMFDLLEDIAQREAAGWLPERPVSLAAE